MHTKRTHSHTHTCCTNTHTHTFTQMHTQIHQGMISVGRGTDLALWRALMLAVNTGSITSAGERSSEAEGGVGWGGEAVRHYSCERNKLASDNIDLCQGRFLIFITDSV